MYKKIKGRHTCSLKICKKLLRILQKEKPKKLKEKKKQYLLRTLLRLSR